MKHTNHEKQKSDNLDSYTDNQVSDPQEQESRSAEEILTPLLKEIGYSYQNIKASTGFAGAMLDIAERAMGEYASQFRSAPNHLAKEDVETLAERLYPLHLVSGHRINGNKELQNAFITGYNANEKGIDTKIEKPLPAQGQREVYGWVKASEGFPKKAAHYNTRYDGIPTSPYFFEFDKILAPANEISKENHCNVEWLELQTPALPVHGYSLGQIKDAIQLAYRHGKESFDSHLTEVGVLKCIGLPNKQQYDTTDELFKHMETVEYEAWGHQAVMLWCTDGEWRSGLRNNKLNQDNRFTGKTAYDALYSLYEYCLKNGFVNPLPALPVQQQGYSRKDMVDCWLMSKYEGMSAGYPGFEEFISSITVLPATVQVQLTKLFKPVLDFIDEQKKECLNEYAERQNDMYAEMNLAYGLVRDFILEQIQAATVQVKEDNTDVN